MIDYDRFLSTDDHPILDQAKTHAILLLGTQNLNRL